MKKLRFAIALQHKDQSICDSAGTVLYGRYNKLQRRFLFTRTGDHELIEMGDYRMVSLREQLNRLIQVDTERRESMEPCLLFRIQKHEDRVDMDCDEVVQKHWEYFQEHKPEFQPYIQTIRQNGLEYTVIPYTDAQSVFTMVKLDSQSKPLSTLDEQIEEFSEKVLRHVVTGHELWKDCWDAVHRVWCLQHNRDINQDDMIAQIGTTLQQQGIVSTMISQWLPTLEILQTGPKNYELDLTGFNTGFLYKYLVSSVQSDSEPVFFLDIIEMEDSLQPGKPLTQGEFLLSKNGAPMDGYISLSNTVTKTINETDTQILEEKSLQTWDNNTTMPLNTTWIHTSNMMGNAMLGYQKFHGSITLTPDPNILTTPERFRRAASIQCIVECYPISGGAKIKEVPLLFGLTKDTCTQDVWVYHQTTELQVFCDAVLTTTNTAYRIKLRWEVFWGKITDMTPSKVVTSIYDPTMYGDFRFDDTPVTHREHVVYSGVNVATGNSGVLIGGNLYLPLTTTDAFSRFPDIMISEPTNRYHIPLHDDNTEIEWWGFTHNFDDPTGFPVILSYKTDFSYTVLRTIQEELEQPNPCICPSMKVGEYSFALGGGRKFLLRSNRPGLMIQNMGTILTADANLPTNQMRIHGTSWTSDVELSFLWDGKQYHFATDGVLGIGIYSLALLRSEDNAIVAKYILYKEELRNGNDFPIRIKGKLFYLRTTTEKPSGIHVAITTLTNGITRYLL